MDMSEWLSYCTKRRRECPCILNCCTQGRSKWEHLMVKQAQTPMEQRYRAIQGLWWHKGVKLWHSIKVATSQEIFCHMWVIGATWLSRDSIKATYVLTSKLILEKSVSIWVNGFSIWVILLSMVMFWLLSGSHGAHGSNRKVTRKLYLYDQCHLRSLLI